MEVFGKEDVSWRYREDEMGPCLMEVTFKFEREACNNKQINIGTSYGIIWMNLLANTVYTVDNFR